MKQDTIIRDEEHIGLIFEGGASRFFYKGTNGRWRDVLTEEDLALYETAAAQLDPGLRSWLEADSAPTPDSSVTGGTPDLPCRTIDTGRSRRQIAGGQSAVQAAGATLTSRVMVPRWCRGREVALPAQQTA